MSRLTIGRAIPCALTPRFLFCSASRATCHLQTLQPKSAIADFKKILALEPKNETVRAQLVSTQKLVKKIDFEKAIETEGEVDAVLRCREMIAGGVYKSDFKTTLTDVSLCSTGECEVDPKYAGPKLEQKDGKYTITLEFVHAMMEWFKDGKALPKRYVWEIVLGAFDQFMAEKSLVDVELEEDVDIDVIGDVHGGYLWSLLEWVIDS